MNTSVSSKPKKSNVVSESKESLVKHPRAKGGESIYDQDELDEAAGINDNEDSDAEDDDFIEAPLQSHRMLTSQDVADMPRPLGSLVLCLQGCYFSTRNFAKRLHRRVYGDSFPWDDFVRTMVLSSTLFVMIGGYWLLRSLKDPVLTALCGVSSIPKAKMLSVFVVLGVVAIYNHLLDEESGFRKEQVCLNDKNIVCSAYNGSHHIQCYLQHILAVLCLWNILRRHLPHHCLPTKPPNHRISQPN
jgi:hypothetical protein